MSRPGYNYTPATRESLGSIEHKFRVSRVVVDCLRANFRGEVVAYLESSACSPYGVFVCESGRKFQVDLSLPPEEVVIQEVP